jgi:hypothetical protein
VSEELILGHFEDLMYYWIFALIHSLMYIGMVRVKNLIFLMVKSIINRLALTN